MTADVLGAAEHMALDEALLLGAPPDVLILRFYRWDGPACTFGYSQPYQAARRACDERGWADVAPVRRTTGGGIVFHDGDLTFSLIFPWDRLCAPETVYKNIHRGVHLGLKAEGSATRLFSPPSRPLGAASACFARAEPMDLVAEDGRKILGGALRKHSAKGLYQGSLRSKGLGLSREVLERAVAVGLEREFGRLPVPPNAAWTGRLRELESRYNSRGWNQRR